MWITRPLEGGLARVFRQGFKKVGVGFGVGLSVGFVSAVMGLGILSPAGWGVLYARTVIWKDLL